MNVIGVRNEKGNTTKERLSGYIDYIRDNGTEDELAIALSEDWEPAQLYEIAEGVKSGIDINLYANRDFNEFKMGYIRLAIEQGLNFKPLLNPTLDEFDLREVYKTIEVG